MQVWRIGHFWVVFCKSLHETIHIAENLFPWRFVFMQIKLTFMRDFESEALGNSEMAFWEDMTFLQRLERTLKAKNSLRWKEDNTFSYSTWIFFLCHIRRSLEDHIHKSYLPSWLDNSGCCKWCRMYMFRQGNLNLGPFLFFQRIRSTVDEKEQKQLLMDLDVVMRSSACEYIVKFYGALFTEVIM